MGSSSGTGETVQRIEAEGGKFSAVRTSAGRVAADACLVALGNESAARLRPLGIRLPIYPVKGYSLTFPVGGWNDAPVVPFADDGHKAGIVRIGDRIRVAGTAEFAGRDRTLNPKRIANLRNFFLSLFPDYPDRSAGGCLDRAPPDDSGRHSLPRTDAGGGSVRQHGPRPPRLDHVLRGPRASSRTSFAGAMPGSISPA